MVLKEIIMKNKAQRETDKYNEKQRETGKHDIKNQLL
jgi:hypothetical protein